MIRDMLAPAFARAIAPSRGAPTPAPLLASARPGPAAAPPLGGHRGLLRFRGPDAPPAPASPRRGAALPPPVRVLMESALGFRFERVRIHADEGAARAAEACGAAAYAMGEDIVFGRQAYAPTRPEGLSLLAHELVHVAQWYNGGRPPVPEGDAAEGRPGFAPLPDSTGRASLEAEASTMDLLARRTERRAASPASGAAAGAGASRGPHATAASSRCSPSAAASWPGPTCSSSTSPRRASAPASSS
jgi:hypothetical protein